MKENSCLFAKHKMLPQIKKIYCRWNNPGEEHVCLLNEKSWIDS